jgi:HK97 family phage portal protein
MGFLSRLFGRAETRSTSWDHLRTGGMYETDAGVIVGPYLAENLASVFGAVQCLSESVAQLSLHTFRKTPTGREEDINHPVSRLFAGSVNEWQSSFDFFELMVAHCLLYGNAYASIERDGRGAVVALNPVHPSWVSVVKIPRTGGYRFDVSMPEGGTRRLLPHEIFHLRDRSSDGIVGVSRLARCREALGGAVALERFSNSTFKNGATLSGVLSHPGQLGDAAAERLRHSFESAHTGSHNAGRVLIAEEGMSWHALSVAPRDAEMLASRRFTVEQIARIFRIPPPILGHMEDSNYSSVSELGRWFVQYSLIPWLRRIESTVERCLLSTESQRTHEVEFDADELLRGDLLTRWQAYRIMRETGGASANEIRKWEHVNPRTDPGGDSFFEPRNMQPEQTGRPIADRGGE